MTRWRPAGARPDPRVRVAEPLDELVWARTVDAGFADTENAPPEDGLALSRAFFRMGGGAVPVLAVQDGVAAAGMLDVDGDVAALFATATPPAYRRRGLQAALLDFRLRMAQERGCTLATIETEPGSASQCNVERAGFRLAYVAASLLRP